MMTTQGRKSENKVDMSPRDIRFSQSSVDTKFRKGKPLKDTLEEILENPEHMIREAIPPIKVYWSSEGYYAAATGNRRLYLFKLLSDYGVIKTVPVIVVTKKPKSKPTHGSQQTECEQETILKNTIERYLADSSEVPEKSDENKAESSATPCSESKKHQTPLQKSSRKALRTLTNNTPHESSKFPKSEERAKRYKRQSTEDGKDKSTPGLREGLRKRKSVDSPPPAIQDPTVDKESQRRDKAPMEMKATATYRSPDKSFEGEDEDSPKRRRLTPSPDVSLETELPVKSATTGNSQEMEDFNFD